MPLLYEFFPVLLFFLAFKFYDIYIATMVGIFATSLIVLMNRIVRKTWDRKQLITLGVFVLFGGLTLYFRDPIFVKWKPTIIFWIFALIVLISQFFMKKPLIQRLMENVLENKATVPLFVWKRINLMWAVFFAGMGAINLYIAYYFSDAAWVNFKFYGLTGALFVFSILQAGYIFRYTQETKDKRQQMR
ncbi:MAG TPA: septation protein A [Gammaproteobacteria bacterium]|nr:septation protein A [Gammaproteobacteria bacterium]